MIPAATSDRTLERMLAMLAADRTDKLDTVPSQDIAAVESPAVRTSRRRCVHLGPDQIGETPSACCSAAPVAVYWCESLQTECVPNLNRGPRDTAIQWCQTCPGYLNGDG